MPNFRATLASVGKLTDIHTSQKNPLGQVVADEMGYEYVYLKGVASLAAGDWVAYVPGTFVTTRLVDSLTGMVAVAMAATLASQFGWFQISGLTPTYSNITTDASADQKPLYRSATAGRASTTAAATKAIFGAVGVGAAASNAGTAQISRPFIFGSATV